MHLVEGDVTIDSCFFYHKGRLIGGNRGVEGNNNIVFFFYDGQSLIYWTENKMYHERTKGIDVIHHIICEIVSLGTAVIREVTKSIQHIYDD